MRATIIPKTQQIAHLQYGGIIRYPLVRVPSPKATRAINESLARIRQDNYDPEEDPQTLTGMDFSVNHNGEDVLSLTILIDSSGAYPVRWYEYRSYLLTTGERILPKALFHPAKMGALVKRLDAELEQEIALARRGKLPRLDPACRDTPLEGHFQVEHLQDFAIQSAGITFYYPYDLPHALKACEPPGRFFLSYAELGPFMPPDGPLAKLIRAARSQR